MEDLKETRRKLQRRSTLWCREQGRNISTHSDKHGSIWHFINIVKYKVAAVHTRKMLGNVNKVLILRLLYTYWLICPALNALPFRTVLEYSCLRLSLGAGTVQVLCSLGWNMLCPVASVINPALVPVKTNRLQNLCNQISPLPCLMPPWKLAMIKN